MLVTFVYNDFIMYLYCKMHFTVHFTTKVKLELLYIHESISVLNIEKSTL